MSQIERLQHIDGKLRRQELFTAQSLAQDLGISEKTIRRDIEALRDEHDMPVIYDQRQRTYRYEGNAPALRVKELPPDLATRDERLSLLLAFAAREQFRGTVIEKHLDTMYQRFRRNLSADDRLRHCAIADKIHFLGPPVPAVPMNIWNTLLYALEEPEILRLSYRTASTGRPTTREIFPHDVIVRHRDWMLLAHDYQAGYVKTFLLRRITNLELTDRQPPTPPAFDVTEYLRTSFDGDQSTGPIHHVKLRFLPEAAQYGREFLSNSTQKITEQPDGSAVVEFDTAALYRVEREVLAWGGRVEVIEPACLSRIIQSRAVRPTQLHPRKKVSQEAR